MNRQFLLTLSLVLFSFLSVTAQTARLQIIHNCPDGIANKVDVWVGNNLELDNFEFRTATAFFDVPSGVPIEIRVKDSTSADTANPLFFQEVTLAANESYVAVANGIISASGYSNSPAFGLDIFTPATETAGMGNTNLLLYHGSPDAPAVDIEEFGAGAGVVQQNLGYSQFSNSYLNLINADYELRVLAAGTSLSVREYEAPLQTLGLAEVGLVALASGFLNPAENSNGPAFGLYAALPTGGPLVALPELQGSVQVIHNSADAAAEVVDVYVEGPAGEQIAKLDNVAFQTASPFVNLPANVDLTFHIADSASTDFASSIFNKPAVLTRDGDFYAVANGIVSPSGYSPATPFDIFIGAAQTQSGVGTETALTVFHGATDAPTVDAFETAVLSMTAIDDLAYGTFSATANLPTNDYSLMIQDETGSLDVREFDAPLSTLNLGGASVLVLASGFLNPAVNSNGEAFGLQAVLPSGGAFTALPMVTGQAQIIHNSADMAAATVDAYVVGPAGEQIAKVDNFDFRTATPFVELPANVDLSLVIADPGSSDASSPIYDETVQLARDENYIVTAHGIASPSGYTPGAGQAPLAFSVFAGARTAAAQSGNTDVLVFHGATDAPTVDVYETAVNNPEAIVVDDLAYGDYISQYLELPTNDYALDVRDENNTTTVQGYQAPLSTLALTDQSITVLASGFLDPSENSNGDAFGLWVALTDGGDLVELPVVTSTGEAVTIEDLSVFPNPSAGLVTFRSDNISEGTQMIISDITGKTVKTLTWNNGNRMEVNLNDQSKGTYFYQLRNDKQTITGKLIIVQ